MALLNKVIAQKYNLEPSDIPNTIFSETLGLAHCDLSNPDTISDSCAQHIRYVEDQILERIREEKYKEKYREEERNQWWEERYKKTQEKRKTIENVLGVDSST